MQRYADKITAQREGFDMWSRLGEGTSSRPWISFQTHSEKFMCAEELITLILIDITATERFKVLAEYIYGYKSL